MTEHQHEVLYEKAQLLYIDMVQREKKAIGPMLQPKGQEKKWEQQNEHSETGSFMHLSKSDKEYRWSLWCFTNYNYNGLHWPSVSGGASASGGRSTQNTNATISVTQQQEVGCP